MPKISGLKNALHPAVANLRFRGSFSLVVSLPSIPCTSGYIHSTNKCPKKFISPENISKVFETLSINYPLYYQKPIKIIALNS